MRRYFFDMLDDETVIPDDEGLMLTSWEAVQRETAKALADLARDEVTQFFYNERPRKLAIDVRDEHGPLLRATLCFEIKRLQ